MWNRKKPSPLLEALVDEGSKAAEGEVKDFLRKVEPTPLGKMIKAALTKSSEVAAEGRDATADDVKDFFSQCRQIVADHQDEADEEPDEDEQP